MRWRRPVRGAPKVFDWQYFWKSAHASARYRILRFFDTKAPPFVLWHVPKSVERVADAPQADEPGGHDDGDQPEDPAKQPGWTYTHTHMLFPAGLKDFNLKFGLFWIALIALDILADGITPWLLAPLAAWVVSVALIPLLLFGAFRSLRPLTLQALPTLFPTYRNHTAWFEAIYLRSRHADRNAIEDIQRWGHARARLWRWRWLFAIRLRLPLLRDALVGCFHTKGYRQSSLRDRLKGSPVASVLSVATVAFFLPDGKYSAAERRNLGFSRWFIWFCYPIWGSYIGLLAFLIFSDFCDRWEIVAILYWYVGTLSFVIWVIPSMQRWLDLSQDGLRALPPQVWQYATLCAEFREHLNKRWTQYALLGIQTVLLTSYLIMLGVVDAGDRCVLFPDTSAASPGTSTAETTEAANPPTAATLPATATDPGPPPSSSPLQPNWSCQ